MKKKIISLKKTKEIKFAQITPPSSKSESNRVLIINALMNRQYVELTNLSLARDTTTMQSLLNSIKELELLDVIDAGTTMRFLISFVAVGKKAKTLTGTSRLQERPIGILTEALKSLGAKVEYKRKRGYPPVTVHPIKTQLSQEVTLRSDVSSQFISSLLMIAPILPYGLIIRLDGKKTSSLPYISMTLKIMSKYGITYTWQKKAIHVPHQPYTWQDKHVPYQIEGDWSAASYWYAVVALSNDLTVKLLGMHSPSLQGDESIKEIMQDLGVSTEEVSHEHAVILRKTRHKSTFSYDFSNCPDLAQTVIVTCACLNISGRFSGLESLKIKETNRIIALQNELKKMNVNLEQVDTNLYSLNGKISINKSQPLSIEVYKDHRMAMAFAPLSMQFPINIFHPEVVVKSYPRFWEDIKMIGLQITDIQL